MSQRQRKSRTSDRSLIGYVVRLCKTCQRTTRSEVFADSDETKEISERRVDIRCEVCRMHIDEPLIVAVIATRLLEVPVGSKVTTESLIIGRVNYSYGRS